MQDDAIPRIERNVLPVGGVDGRQPVLARCRPCDLSGFPQPPPGVVLGGGQVTVAPRYAGFDLGGQPGRVVRRVGAGVGCRDDIAQSGFGEVDAQLTQHVVGVVRGMHLVEQIGAGRQGVPQLTGCPLRRIGRALVGGQAHRHRLGAVGMGDDQHQ